MWQLTKIPANKSTEIVIFSQINFYRFLCEAVWVDFSDNIDLFFKLAHFRTVDFV